MKVGIEPVFTIGTTDIEYWENKTICQLAKEFKIIKNKSLTQLSEIIKTAKYFIGNDSGISHIASSLGIESYIIFGSTNSTLFPLFQNILFLYHLFFSLSRIH